MSTISANTLFHFTREKNTLINILKTKFYPRLCLEENFIFSKKSMKMAYPMICFCDIPLSQINNHTNVYGRYAIGLKKEWAIKNGVTPILYTHKESLITKNLRINYTDVERALNLYPLDTEMPNLWGSLLYTSFFIKPYRGKQDFSGVTRNVIFYNEREWRYTLPRKIFIEQLQRVISRKFTNAFLSENEFNDPNTKQSINKENEQYGLEFTPNDINYIIVEKEDEILDIMRVIRGVKSPHYNNDDVDLLATRIISMERISEDF